SRMLNPDAMMSGGFGSQGGVPSGAFAANPEVATQGGTSVVGAPTAGFQAAGGMATAATPNASVRRPALPLGAGFSGYETFAVQQLATRGFGSDGLVARSFEPILSNPVAAAAAN